MTETTSTNPWGAFENAATALDAYEQRTFPGSAVSHRDDPLYADGTLRTLLSDLLHYAARMGVDFEEALNAARDVYADDITAAAATAYTIGDQVQLRNGAAKSGTVVGISLSPRTRETTYEVHIAGEREPRPLPARELAKAPLFSTVTTRFGPVRTAAHAEALLIELGVRIYQAEHGGPGLEADHYTDRERLTTALAEWSGTSTSAIQASLGPRIVLAYATTIPPANGPRVAPPLGPVQVASAGYPYDITNGVQVTEPAPTAGRPILQTPDQQRRASRP